MDYKALAISVAVWFVIVCLIQLIIFLYRRYIRIWCFKFCVRMSAKNIGKDGEKAARWIERGCSFLTPRELLNLSKAMTMLLVGIKRKENEKDGNKS